MPELPEVEALRDFLDERCVGKVVADTQLVAFACLKTFDPPLSALAGLEIERTVHAMARSFQEGRWAKVR